MALRQNRAQGDNTGILVNMQLPTKSADSAFSVQASTTVRVICFF